MQTQKHKNTKIQKPRKHKHTNMQTRKHVSLLTGMQRKGAVSKFTLCAFHVYLRRLYKGGEQTVFMVHWCTGAAPTEQWC